MTPRLIPTMTTDEEAEAFLGQDLSDLDFAAFQPLTWEAEPKTARVNMRLPESGARRSTSAKGAQGDVNEG